MKKLIFVLISIFIVASLPKLGGYPPFLMKIMTYAIIAAAFNLLLGYGGLLSFGHAAFVGIAGYTTGYLVTSYQHFGVLESIFLGGLVAGLVGVFFGWIAIRRSGIYFAMITLALSQMLYFIFVQANFTGGEDGLQGITRGQLFGMSLRSDGSFYFLVLLITTISLLCIWRIIESPFGRSLSAIRENESRMISLGYSVERYKLTAFILSAFFAGIGGSTKAVVFGAATLSDASWHMSGTIILMTLIGGIGTILGPIIGAIIMVTLENKIGDFGYSLMKLTGIQEVGKLGESVPVVIGFVFVISVLLFRRGIVGEFNKLFKKEFKTHGK